MKKKLFVTWKRNDAIGIVDSITARKHKTIKKGGKVVEKLLKKEKTL